MSCQPDGSGLELFAWGLRNPYGLGFLPDGRLLAVDQGADDRGSRPVAEVPDLLFAVERGGWYGWPDFVDGDPITDARYRPERGPAPSFVLANHADLPRPARALLRFPPHAAATKFDVAPAEHCYAGDLFVCLFGDERPMTAPPGPSAGRCVARIDTRTWTLHPLLATQLYRPIDARFHPREGALYILDFGVFEMTATGIQAGPSTGGLWRCSICA